MGKKLITKEARVELLTPAKGEYVYSDVELTKLKDLVAKVVDVKWAVKNPNWHARARVLQVPYERLMFWRTTKEYKTLLAEAVHLAALEGVAEALPTQVMHAKSHGEGSAKSFDSLIKVARLEPPAQDKAQPAGGSVVINIEQALIQQGRQRLGMPEKADE